MSHHASPRPSPADRLQEAQRATWISAAVNLAMTLAQLVVGWLANSQSLIAHGLHSFSDLLSDFLVLYASRESANPADEGHPYGHARFETAATLLLGISLVIIGGGILWESVSQLQHLEALPAIAWPAFWIAVATVVSKEALYRYLIRVASRLHSQLLAANALHTRADAASALVVVVGIGGALAGWPLLDSIAAALMGFMILRMGASLSWEALSELTDAGLDSEQVDAIRATIAATPGVVDLHELRTRRMAHQALVDAHVQVNPRISVSEGHRIAESVRERLLAQHPEILDVLVHIDPESDLSPASSRPPERAELLARLQPLLTDLPAPERIVLHYLGGQVEAEIFVSSSAFASCQDMHAAAQRLQQACSTRQEFSSIRLICQNAHK